MFKSYVHYVNVCDEVITFPCGVAGGRPDEAPAAFVVRHAGAGPHASAHAQQPAGRDDAAQWSKVRSTVSRPPGGAHPSGPFQRPHGQTAGSQIRRHGLHLRQVPAPSQSW